MVGNRSELVSHERRRDHGLIEAHDSRRGTRIVPMTLWVIAFCPTEDVHMSG